MDRGPSDQPSLSADSRQSIRRGDLGTQTGAGDPPQVMVVIFVQWDAATELAVDIATLNPRTEALAVHFTDGPNGASTTQLTEDWTTSTGTIPLVCLSCRRHDPAHELLDYLDHRHPGRRIRVLIPVSETHHEPWLDELEQHLPTGRDLTVHRIRASAAR